MPNVKVVVVDEDGNPQRGVTVAAYSLANFPDVIDRIETDDAGSASFSVAGPVFFDAFNRRGVSMRDRNYPGKIQIQIVAIGGFACYDYVIDADGFGTHLTVREAMADFLIAAAAASDVSRAAWVCGEDTDTNIEFAVGSVSGNTSRATLSIEGPGTYGEFSASSRAPRAKLIATISSNGDAYFKSTNFAAPRLIFKHLTIATADAAGTHTHSFTAHNPAVGSAEKPRITYDGCEFEVGSIANANGVLHAQGGTASGDTEALTITNCSGNMGGLRRFVAGSASGGVIIRNSELSMFHFGQDITTSTIAYVVVQGGGITTASHWINHASGSTGAYRFIGAAFRQNGSTVWFRFASGQVASGINIFMEGLDYSQSNTTIGAVTASAPSFGSRHTFFMDGCQFKCDGVNAATAVVISGSNWLTAAIGFITAPNFAAASSGTATGLAPTGADYLVGTAQAGLSAEIVVGTTPGGELGGTWAAPTIDATHSGSAHHALVTLGADVDTILSLTGQQLDLDTQLANLVFAGPASGGAVDPTFRALVSLDLPATVVEDTDANWLDLTDGGATALHSHAGGGGSGHTIRENGVDLAARTGLNFVDTDAGAGLVTDDAGGDETEINLSLYAILSGRAGGQVIIGGTAASEALTLESTSHATKGVINARDKLVVDNNGLTTDDLFFLSAVSATRPGITFDTGDRLSYDRTNNRFEFAFGAVEMLRISSSATAITLAQLLSGVNVQTAYEFPNITTEDAEVRFFRSTSTTGGVALNVFLGDNTTTAIFRAAKTAAGVVQLFSTGYARIGSSTTPINVTAGDLTATRLIVPNATLADSDLISLLGGPIGIANNGVLRFYDTSSTNYIGIRAPATNQTEQYVIHLPNDDPAAGDLLKVTSVSSPDVITEFGRVAHGEVSVTGMKQQLTLMARAGYPTTTAGASFPGRVEFGTNDRDVFVIDFDPTTQEYAFWEIVMPDNWDAGTVTAVFHWITSTGDSSRDVVWGLAAVSSADGDGMDTAFGGPQEIADAASATANQLRISSSTPAITVAGAGAGEYVTFLAYRNPTHATDDLATDARLLAIVIEYGITALSV